METEIVKGTLSEDTLGYTKGAEVITCNGREPGKGIKWLFGLIKDKEDETWGNFVDTLGLPVENLEPFYDLRTADALSTVTLLIARGLLKLPANYFKDYVMQKFKTRIVYYNNGKIISTSETNILATDVTQAKINTALGVILAVHTQTPPFNAMANVYIGRRKVAEYIYSDNGKEVSNGKT